MTRANNNIHVHCLEGVKRPECPCFDNTLLIKCLIERENNFFLFGTSSFGIPFVAAESTFQRVLRVSETFVAAFEVLIELLLISLSKFLVD